MLGLWKPMYEDGWDFGPGAQGAAGDLHLASRTPGAWSPAADIKETDDHITVEVDLPGVNLDDIKATVEHGVLTIEAERRPAGTERVAYHLVERCHGKYVRSFVLPAEVDAGGIAAQYCNGVLVITLPKREEAKPRAIAIKAV